MQRLLETHYSSLSWLDANDEFCSVDFRFLSDDESCKAGKEPAALATLDANILQI
jgi:hypothetical protein